MQKLKSTSTAMQMTCRGLRFIIVYMQGIWGVREWRSATERRWAVVPILVHGGRSTAELDGVWRSTVCPAVLLPTVVPHVPRCCATELQNVVFSKDFQGFWVTVSSPGCGPSGMLGGPGHCVCNHGRTFVFLRFSNGFAWFRVGVDGDAARVREPPGAPPPRCRAPKRCFS